MNSVIDGGKLIKILNGLNSNEHINPETFLEIRHVQRDVTPSHKLKD